MYCTNLELNRSFIEDCQVLVRDAPKLATYRQNLIEMTETATQALTKKCTNYKRHKIKKTYNYYSLLGLLVKLASPDREGSFFLK